MTSGADECSWRQYRPAGPYARCETTDPQDYAIADLSEAWLNLAGERAMESNWIWSGPMAAVVKILLNIAVAIVVVIFLMQTLGPPTMPIRSLMLW